MSHERRAFGERLRLYRESQKITLEDIADVTKVAASLFAGLERGDCARWPGGMYNRAFIRAYATAVGLDADETAAEFVKYFDKDPAAIDPSELPVHRSVFQRAAVWLRSRLLGATDQLPGGPGDVHATGRGAGRLQGSSEKTRTSPPRPSGPSKKSSKRHRPLKARA